MNSFSNLTRYNLLKLFLEKRGWTILQENERFIKYLPPAEIESDEEYFLTIPKNYSAPDFTYFIQKVIKNLSELYTISQDTLLYLINEESTILSLQFIDSKTNKGTIPFLDFDSIIENLRKTFIDMFTFLMTDFPKNDKIADEAINFLRSCNFLQTETGSYVTKIQLPNKYIIREATFFDPEGIQSIEISNRISRILEFITSRIFTNDQTIFTNEFLEDNAELINLDVLEDLSTIFSKIEMDEIKFHFHYIDHYYSIPSGKLTTEKKKNFIEYLSFIKEKLTDTIELNIEGKIVELRSRNPESNHNYIVVTALIENHKNYVAAILNNQEYASAILAHKNNREIRLRGKAKKLKTQYKILKLEELVVL